MKWTSSGFTQTPVHPCSRGEHPRRAAISSVETGSSPLARGAHTESVGVHLCLRLIPTHAGNIGTPQLRNGGRSAHPRSRGEHASAEPNTLSHCGSSPLARGALTVHQHGRHLVRLIPARAGNILHRPGCIFTLWAHPRSRGEHAPSGSSKAQRPGSSPLARGTSPAPVPSGAIRGLIPARAGNTST